MDYVVTRYNEKTNRTDILFETSEFNWARDLVKLAEENNNKTLYTYTIEQKVFDKAQNLILYKTPHQNTTDEWQKAHRLIEQQRDGLITLFEFIQEMRLLAEHLPANNPWLYD